MSGSGSNEGSSSGRTLNAEDEDGSVFNVVVNNYNPQGIVPTHLHLTATSSTLDPRSRVVVSTLMRKISQQLSDEHFKEIHQDTGLTGSFSSKLEMLQQLMYSEVIGRNFVEKMDTLYFLVSVRNGVLAEDIKETMSRIPFLMNEDQTFLQRLGPPSGHRQGLPALSERSDEASNIDRCPPTPEETTTSNTVPKQPGSSSQGVQSAVFDAQSTEDFYSRHFGNKMIYQVQNNPKGHALIISNTSDFQHGFDRQGGERDEYLIESLFNQLGLKTILRRNLTASKMDSVLKSYAKKTFHAVSDMCVVVIMTHGGLDPTTNSSVVHGTDMEPTPVHYIINLFNNRNCKMLQGKPKLFLIQSCRGFNHDRGASMVSPHKALEEFKEPDFEKEPVIKDIHIAEDGAPVKQNTLPTQSDIFIAQSALPGYSSYRSTENGSHFINAVTNVFMEGAQTTHVADLMTEVKHVLAQQTANLGHRGDHKMMADCTDLLTKKFYFFPGFPKQDDDTTSYKQYYAPRRKYDTLLHTVLLGPIRKKVLTTVNPTTLMLYMYCIPSKIQHSIKRTQEVDGKKEAMEQLLNELVPFDDWGKQFLDALWYSGHAELARDLYACIEEASTPRNPLPINLVTEQTPNLPRSPPPPYSLLSERSDQPTSTYVQDQEQALLKHSTIQNSLSETPAHPVEAQILHAQAEPVSCMLQSPQITEATNALTERTNHLENQGTLFPSSSSASGAVQHSNNTNENNDELSGIEYCVPMDVIKAKLKEQSLEDQLPLFSNDDNENLLQEEIALEELQEIEIPIEAVEKSNSCHRDKKPPPTQDRLPSESGNSGPPEISCSISPVRTETINRPSHTITETSGQSGPTPTTGGGQLPPKSRSTVESLSTKENQIRLSPTIGHANSSWSQDDEGLSTVSFYSSEQISDRSCSTYSEDEFIYSESIGHLNHMPAGMTGQSLQSSAGKDSTSQQEELGATQKRSVPHMNPDNGFSLSGCINSESAALDRLRDPENENGNSVSQSSQKINQRNKTVWQRIKCRKSKPVYDYNGKDTYGNTLFPGPDLADELEISFSF